MLDLGWQHHHPKHGNRNMPTKAPLKNIQHSNALKYVFAKSPKSCCKHATLSYDQIHIALVRTWLWAKLDLPTSNHMFGIFWAPWLVTRWMSMHSAKSYFNGDVGNGSWPHMTVANDLSSPSWLQRRTTERKEVNLYDPATHDWWRSHNKSIDRTTPVPG